MSLRSGLFISSFFLLFSMPAGKKEQLLQLSKKYFPENYIVLKEYDEASINDLAHGNSPAEYITDVSTIVHEAYHNYHGRFSSYYDTALLYRINDTLSFSLKRFNTFPAIEINNIVPAATRKKIFRYETYVNTKDKYNVTQQFGVLGLLEEMTAYYQSFDTEVALFSYYKDKYGWKNTDAWMNYLGNIASYRYSITEFELFISWYLQYAKTKYPVVYKSIITNTGLKKLVRFLHTGNARLSLLYDQNRQTLLKQFEGRLVVEGNYIYDKKTLTGKGLFDDEVAEMNSLLGKPEHILYKNLLQ